MKFLFVGGLNTAVGYGVFVLLILLNAHYIIAATVSHIVGVTNSYLWNKFFTFKNNKKISHQEISKFIVVYGVVYIVNLGLLWWLIDIRGLNPLVAQLINVVVIAIISFFGQKYWTFKMENQNEISLDKTN